MSLEADTVNVPKPTNPPVYLDDKGTPRTTSRDVAVQFGKNHRDVLRDIDRLLEGCADLRGLMFQEVRAFDQGANRVVRSFTMVKDGFALLVMGYTGPTALKFKLAFPRSPFRRSMGSPGYWIRTLPRRSGLRTHAKSGNSSNAT